MDKCNIIKDLLPLYAEDMLSDDSRRLVEAHISECEKCRNDLEEAKREINLPSFTNDTEKYAPYISAMKKYKDLIITLIFGIFTLALIISVGVCDAIDMFLNLALMIPIGALGYVILKSRAFYKLPLIIAISMIFSALMRLILDEFDSYLLYTLLYIVAALLGAASAALLHSAFKKRPSKAVTKRVVSLILGLVFTALSTVILFGLAGNPFIYISASIDANSYVNERFEDKACYISKIRYDCITSGNYIVYIRSRSDESLSFTVRYSSNGKMQYCDYDRKQKTVFQSWLKEKYGRFVDNKLHSYAFPFEIVGADSSYFFYQEAYLEEPYLDSVTLEKLDTTYSYDISELGKTNGMIRVTVYTESISLSRAKDIYLDLKNAFDELGIGFRRLSVNLVEINGNNKKSYNQIDYENITPEKLTELITEIKPYVE